MSNPLPLAHVLDLLPALFMTISMIAGFRSIRLVTLWRIFLWLSILSGFVPLTLLLLYLSRIIPSEIPPWYGLQQTLAGTWIALLVQWLGVVIGAFSVRYLRGENGQAGYVAALSGVLAAVHVLLLADQWMLLIVAWSLAGIFLQRLLCFYEDRPFAVLAAHKKQLADRAADALLVAAAILAWWQTGSTAISDLQKIDTGMVDSWPIQTATLLLVTAAIIRTALMPLHGWLIQVMEAPTPVSALLHAGVVNLGAFVLIRFAPLLNGNSGARWLLVIAGLFSATLAGLVMLTRVSIKVRLAWSTLAQMGFMLLECGLGLYSLALLHLMGHSLYKAHSFLESSSVVRSTRLQEMRGNLRPSLPSQLAAPLISLAIVSVTLAILSSLLLHADRPWWWTGTIAIAWAPLIWMVPMRQAMWKGRMWEVGRGILGVMLLTILIDLVHQVPLGVENQPFGAAGALTFFVLTALYLSLVIIQHRPESIGSLRRWSYAGYYLDEIYTRVALWIWPRGWSPHPINRLVSPPTSTKTCP